LKVFPPFISQPRKKIPIITFYGRYVEHIFIIAAKIHPIFQIVIEVDFFEVPLPLDPTVF